MKDRSTGRGLETGRAQTVPTPRIPQRAAERLAPNPSDRGDAQMPKKPLEGNDPFFPFALFLQTAVF